jgi:hypothetical protein
MNTDMKRLEMLIADLNKIGIKPFIGYGNPNADILIIGKECAEENTERQEKFYTHNFEHRASLRIKGITINHRLQRYNFYLELLVSDKKFN